MKRKFFELIYVDDEHLEVFYNLQPVISVNHDQHGWAGMELVKETVKKIADMIGAKVEEH